MISIPFHVDDSWNRVEFFKDHGFINSQLITIEEAKSMPMSTSELVHEYFVYWIPLPIVESILWSIITLRSICGKKMYFFIRLKEIQDLTFLGAFIIITKRNKNRKD